MKRILQAIAAAVVATAPHAALALDADTSLDRFPSSAPTAVSGTREWRGDGDGGRIELNRDHRGGRYDDRHGAFHDRDDRGGAPGWRRAGSYRSSGSIIDLRTYGGAVERGSFYGTSGTGSGSVIVIGPPDDLGSIVADGGRRGAAKILDVETDRLDRQAYGKDGLAVAYVGTAKIIRIAPNYRRGLGHDVGQGVSETEATPFAELRPEEQAVTVYPDTDMTTRPVDPPARRVAEAAPPAAPPTPAPAGFLEPWTPDWLRDCVARHSDFDPSLGTYRAPDGKRRFCTGEP